MNEPVASGNISTGASEGSGRIVVVTEPALPATCVVCARSANGAIKFIDFNVSLDWYGSVVICEDCCKEALGVLDYTPNINFTNKVQELEETRAQLEVALSELVKYKSALDGLSFIRPDLDPLGVDDVVESEDVAEAVGPSESADSERLETESDPDGQDSVGGLKDLSIFAD